MIKTGVSLFAGIGGFDLAMERAGINVVATVEWDKHAQGVLARRFPNSKLYGDITGVTGEQLINAGFDPANGIITGGFPCQDLSVAGRRAGLIGSRSGLFWEICRLLDETKAQNFILENVPGLLSSNEGRDMGTVIRALEERGYSLAWRVLDAQHFGVAQRRRRVFIIGHLGNDWRTPAEILAIAESSARYSEQSNTKRKEVAASVSDGITDDSRAGNFELYDFPKESVSPTLNARRAHDTMTYQEVARMQGFGDYQMDEISGALKARDYKDATDLVIQPFVKIIRSGARAEDGSLPAEVWAERDIAPTLNIMDNNGESHATVLNVDPTFFYAKSHQDVRIQGDVINTLAATMGTGGGNTPMVHAIQNTVIGRKDTSGPQGKGYGNEEDPMFTLDTTSPHAVAFHLTQTPTSGEVSPTMGSSPGGMGMMKNSTVRRLTPVECERLQGFPDQWTEGQADSHRYKQLGNAVAVPVVEWIIQRFIQATH
jgi:DNA (cytosine-5)-methyltransferase 1